MNNAAAAGTWPRHGATTIMSALAGLVLASAGGMIPLETNTKKQKKNKRNTKERRTSGQGFLI